MIPGRGAGWNTPAASACFPNGGRDDTGAGKSGMAVASGERRAVRWWRYGALGATSLIVLLSGCALNDPGDTQADDEGREISEVQQPATAAGCTATISGPTAGVYGEDLHLTASAQCNTGPAEVQWYHRGDCAYFVVQPYSTSPTLDYPVNSMIINQFYALVRVAGTTSVPDRSNDLTIKTVDNTPQCTSVKITAPHGNQTLHTGLPQTLTARATCPEGSVAEYQFWVKPSGASDWTMLPGYTTTSSSWTPPSSGSWAIKAVVRTTGSHVHYQIGAESVTINAMP